MIIWPLTNAYGHYRTPSKHIGRRVKQIDDFHALIVFMLLLVLWEPMTLILSSNIQLYNSVKGSIWDFFGSSIEERSIFNIQRT